MSICGRADVGRRLLVQGHPRVVNENNGLQHLSKRASNLNTVTVKPVVEFRPPLCKVRHKAWPSWGPCTYWEICRAQTQTGGGENFSSVTNTFIYLICEEPIMKRVRPSASCLGKMKVTSAFGLEFFSLRNFFQGWGRGKSWSNYQLDGHITRSREMLSEVASFNLALNYTRSGFQLFQSVPLPK